MGRANRGDVFFCVFHSLEVADGAYPAGRHEMRVDGEFRELLPAFLAHLLRLFRVCLGVAARKDTYAVARGLLAFAAAGFVGLAVDRSGMAFAVVLCGVVVVGACRFRCRFGERRVVDDALQGIVHNDDYAAFAFGVLAQFLRQRVLLRRSRERQKRQQKYEAVDKWFHK